MLTSDNVNPPANESVTGSNGNTDTPTTTPALVSRKASKAAATPQAVKGFGEPKLGVNTPAKPATYFVRVPFAGQYHNKFIAGDDGWSTTPVTQDVVDELNAQWPGYIEISND